MIRLENENDVIPKGEGFGGPTGMKACYSS